MTTIEAMAGNDKYHKLTVEGLRKLFNHQLGRKKSSPTLKDKLKGGTIIEFAAGSWRNRASYEDIGFTHTHLVDMDEDCLRGLDAIPGVSTSAMNIDKWIRENSERMFTVLLCVWSLSYIFMK